MPIKKSHFTIWIGEKFKSYRHYLSANNKTIFIGYYKYLYRPKPGSISAFLDVYSKSLKNKLTVIQIGANDGITHDPIHKFIKRDKWKGVLLEPQAFVHDNFLHPIYAKSSGIHTICAAIGAEDCFRKLFKIGFSNMRWATGLASFEFENVQKAFISGFVKDQCHRFGISIPEKENERIVSVDVRVICPETLLRTYSITKIDLLQIDCEGYDYEVIKLFNIQKTQPGVIIFENSHIGMEDQLSCLSLLKQNGYQVKTMGPNTMAMLHPTGIFANWFTKPN